MLTYYARMSTDLTLVINEARGTLHDRLDAFPLENTRSFSSVGYFYVSRFSRIFRSLGTDERIGVLVGLEREGDTRSHAFYRLGGEENCA